VKTSAVVSPVTARYAGALFELAREANVLDTVQRDTEFLGNEVADASMRGFLFDSRVGQEKKAALLERFGAHLHPLTFNLLRLLAKKRRLSVLLDLRDAFRQRVMEERGAVEGVVESAHPLGAAEQAELAVAIGARLGKEVVLENRVVPDLLAGVRVIVSNRMIDFSASGRLEGLRAHLLAARLTSAPD
jgi:F-type H+-transporting ATPase subunit delta